MTSISLRIANTIHWLWNSKPLEEARIERKARELFLDTLGCAIAGFSKPEVADLASSLAELEGGDLSLPGLSAQLSPINVAYILALSACWDEACEGLARAHGRPGLHALPPALSLGMAMDRDYGAVLEATVRGYEVAGRLGERMRIPQGMHVDGTWGTAGAVITSAALLAMSPAGAVAAVEAAACQTPWSLYFPIAEGATARNAYVAEAVARGIRIAYAIDSGMTAPRGALDDFDTRALRGQGARAILAEENEWLIEQGYLKPYAAVRHVHYGVAAALKWRAAQSKPSPSRRIDSLILEIYPEALTYCANRAPRTAIQAQFSLSYGVAAALVLGDLSPDAYLPSTMDDPEVQRLEGLVQLVPLPEQLSGRQASLQIQTKGCKDLVTSGSIPGDAEYPFTGPPLAEKFIRYASPVLGATHSQRLCDQELNGPLKTPIRAIVC